MDKCLDGLDSSLPRSLGRSSVLSYNICIALLLVCFPSIQYDEESRSMYRKMCNPFTSDFPAGHYDVKVLYA